MTHQRADKDQMDLMHRLVCERLTAVLQKGTVWDPKYACDVPIPASLYAVAIKFLNDNDIKGLPAEGSPLSKLLASFNFDQIKADLEQEAADAQ